MVPSIYINETILKEAAVYLHRAAFRLRKKKSSTIKGFAMGVVRDYDLVGLKVYY